MIGRIKKLMMNTVMLPYYKSLMKKENNVSLQEGAIASNDLSPERFEIPIEAMKTPGFNGIPMNRKVMPSMLGSYRGIRKSILELKKNPETPKTEITTGFLKEIEEFVKTKGVSSIGYTTLPETYIFQNKAVLYTNGIVLTYEMDADLIEQAPSVPTFNMIHDTYNRLGQAANALANFLRENGYAAHPSHPLGGIVLFPPLAESAGLGYRGLHGLIISPEHGSRVRLAAVFTSIENLPFNESFEHNWIGEYCQTCKRCVKTCPGEAMYESPILTSNDEIITYVDQKKCFPYFLRDHGCTVCIKECPFSKIDYYKLKEKFVRHKQVTAE